MDEQKKTDQHTEKLLNLFFFFFLLQRFKRKALP